MKDALKRAAQAVGLMPAPEAAVDAVEAVADVAIEAATLEAPALAVATEADAALNELQAKFEAQAADLAAALAQLDEVKAALAAVVDAKAKADADALVAKMAARKEAVVAALGTERADAFMVAAETMSDTQFTTVMAAMQVTAEVEADKPEFKEVGVDAQADVDKLVAEAETSGTGAILKAKYQQAAN